MAKLYIDEVFMDILNKLKESNMDNDLYNFILISYDNDKEYFIDNIIFKNNRELFYTIYINFKTICTKFNYRDYYKKINSLSLIYFDKLDEEYNNDIIFSMTNTLFNIENEVNDKDDLTSKNVLYSLRVIFNNKCYLKEVLSKIMFSNDTEEIANFLLDLRINISEDELFNIFNYLINNINKKEFNLEEFKTKIKQNNNIYLEDYKYFLNYEENHNNLFESVNGNMDSYKRLMEKLKDLEQNSTSTLDNIDSCLSSLVRRLNKSN